MDKENKYDPLRHHRRSIRFKGYDYSQAGAYYLTICIKDRLQLLGEINDNQMILNNAGKMVNKWWEKLPEKFPTLELDEYQIMPDHFHAILKITTTKNNVGVDPCVNPNTTKNNVRVDPCVNPNTRVQPTTNTFDIKLQSIIPDNTDILYEHLNSPLYEAIRWFKTMATNEYIRNVKTGNWLPFNGKLFQRNYWEHIIRNEDEYSNIVAYIRNNPTNWKEDKLH